MNVLLTPIGSVRDDAETIEQRVSFYCLCEEVLSTYRGMMIAASSTYWTKNCAKLDASQLARELFESPRRSSCLATENTNADQRTPQGIEQNKARQRVCSQNPRGKFGKRIKQLMLAKRRCA